jgi:hypothetical protein
MAGVKVQPLDLDSPASAVGGQQHIAQRVDHVVDLAFAQAGTLGDDFHQFLFLHGAQPPESGA